MVFFNYALRKLNAKIVYYGPGLCGKTTNLVWIHENFEGAGRGKMLSLATEGDRTIFFDLLPLDIGTVRGMDVTLQLYTVPGQVHYNATRQMVLKGADGVVFVADSQRAMLSSNIQSWNNLKQNLLLQGIELASFPHVLQFNKRDLTDILSVEELDEALNEYDAPIFESVATTGIGVQETLEGIIKLVMRNLRNRYEEEVGGERGFGFAPAPTAAPAPSPRTAPAAEIHPFPGVGMARPPVSSFKTDAVSPETPLKEDQPDAVTHPVFDKGSEYQEVSEAEQTQAEASPHPALETEAGDAGEAVPPASSGAQPGGVTEDEAAGSEWPVEEAPRIESEPWVPPVSGDEVNLSTGRETGELPGARSPEAAETPAVFEEAPFVEEPAAEPFGGGEEASPFDVPEPITEPAWSEAGQRNEVFEPEPEAAAPVSVQESDAFMTQDISAGAVDELVAGVVQASTIEAPFEAGLSASVEAESEAEPEEPEAYETPVVPAEAPAEESQASAEPFGGGEAAPHEEVVVFGSGDPFVFPGEAPAPAVSASASAVVQLSDGGGIPEPGAAIEPSANQLHVTLEGTQALARSGDVRELDITVPVPGGWIGNRRVTLQLRLTLVPADEEET